MPNREKAHFLIASAALLTVAGVLHAQQASPPKVPENDIDKLNKQLYDPQSKDDLRDQAASRLLVRPDPSARAILSGALMSYSQPAVQRSATHALADNPTADAALINPLFALLDSNNSDVLITDAARALTAYKSNGEVLTRLLLQATNGPDVRIRIAAIHAAGTFVDKRGVETLLPLLDPANQPAAINTAASEALAYMTGIGAAGDLAFWNAWWEKYRTKSDADFQGDLVRTRATRYDQTQTSFNDMRLETRRLAQERYQKGTREERADLLLRLMRSSEVAVREIGCDIAQVAAESDVTVAQPIKEQLRDLIGDASPNVRKRAAAGLALINDAESLVPLLVQLNQESDSSVRAAIADALRPIRDVRSVPALMALLDDDSIATAQAGAEALAERELGLQLRQTNPPLAEKLAEKLRETLANRTTAQNPGTIDLRNSLIQAMTPLQSQPLARELTRMLNSPSEAPKVRRSLIAAVGEYQNPQFADAIAACLDDKFDWQIRLAAVQALGQTANSFGEFEKRLYDRIDPKVEPQPEVQKAAWEVLIKLFAKAPVDQLQPWELRLKNDPQKLVVLYTELRKRAANPNDAAGRSQQIGETYARFEQWDKAIEAFQESMTFAQNAKNAGRIEILSEEMTNAYLGARQYGKAVDFVAQQIKADPGLQQTLGAAIRIEAERLVYKTPKGLTDATQLIDLTLKMDPPLLRKYADGLQALRAEVQKRSNEQNVWPFRDRDGVLNAYAPTR